MAARREQILQAAIICFSRKGYHLTTMDDIVKESGMSKGSLYWHFKGKKDILFAVMNWYLGQLTEEMKIAIQQIPTAEGKLKFIFEIFAESYISEDTLFSVFIDFYAETRHDEEVTAIFRQGLSPFLDYVTGIIQEGINSGEFKPVDSRYMAVLLMSASEGLLLYKMILADEFEWERMSQLFSDTLLAGILVEGHSEVEG